MGTLRASRRQLGISPFVAPQRGLEGRHGLVLGAHIEF